MLTTGLSLAILTGAGFYAVYRKMPRSVRKFLNKHPLLTDAIAVFLTYTLFGGTLVALFAAAWLGLIVSVMLALTSNPRTEALMELYAQKIVGLKDKFIEWVATKTPEQQQETPKLEMVK